MLVTIIIYFGRLEFWPNGNFRYRFISGLNFSRYPPGAVNSPGRTLECYREIRRYDPKICRNNNVPVDPFAFAWTVPERRENMVMGWPGMCAITVVSTGNCCRWRPRFNYPWRPQNTEIDLHGTKCRRGGGGPVTFGLGKGAGRVIWRKPRRFYYSWKDRGGGGGSDNVVGSGNWWCSAYRHKRWFFFFYSHTQNVSERG